MSPPVDDPYVGDPPEPPKPVDDPLTSLASMEQEVSTLEDEDVTAPATSCGTPWLEVFLYDDDGEPAQGADYDLSAPGVPAQKGKLDERGCVRVEGVEADDPDALDLQVAVDRDADGEITGYRVELVANEPSTTTEDADEDDDVEDLDWLDFETPWQPS